MLELAARLNVSDCVRMLGWLSPKRVTEIIDQATMVLMPSRWEPFGLVALEAAQRGRVCLASSVGGLPEVVRHQQTGILVPPDEAERWAAAICELLRNPSLVMNLGVRAGMGVATIRAE